MRLWHKDLIPVLPRQQLIGQWRECCCIAKNIADNGTPNHLLVNYVMDDLLSFSCYCELVITEMKNRNYKVSEKSIKKLENNFYIFSKRYELLYDVEYDFEHSNISSLDSWHIFGEFHNVRYLIQCYYNLQEKYDCGGITDEDWYKIRELVKDKTKDKTVSLFN